MLDPHNDYFYGELTKYIWEDVFDQLYEDVPNNAPESRVLLVPTIEFFMLIMLVTN